MLALVAAAGSIPEEIQNVSAGLSTLMHLAAWTAIRDEIRERKRRRRAYDQGRGPESRRRRDEVAAPAEASELLAKACLDSVDRELMALKLRDFNNVEAARELGISKQAVGIRMRAIKGRLEELLGS